MPRVGFDAGVPAAKDRERGKPPLPCASCPWRTSKGAETIPLYSENKACRLVKTCGEFPAFRTIMACHSSPLEKPTTCLGYLARDGRQNFTVVSLRRQGWSIPFPDDVLRACQAAGIRLHKNYTAVLRKLKRSTKAVRVAEP
jgi:hypothetical protein